MSDTNDSIPRHVALIMDGNGRWASARGLARIEGHAAGAESVRSVIRAASRHGVAYITLYAFSTENWNRPREEVDALMELFCRSVINEKEELAAQGARVVVIGDRSALSDKVREHMEQMERHTCGGKRLTVAIALNYGGREEIAAAVRAIAESVAGGRMTPEEVTQDYISNNLYTAGMPDPDLLIRTSGEKRLSNFLLWQSAYAELYFTDTLWPDFGEADFAQALAEYARRERRYGKIESVKR